MKEIDYSNYFWQNELVRLRSGREEDWDVLYVNLFDSKARRLLQYEIEMPPDIDKTKPKPDAAPDGRLWFAIETLDGRFVGGCNINSIDEKNGTFSIGMQIDRDNRGKGYGTAAMRLVLKYAFHERRLNKFYAHILEGNVPSGTMLKKLGCVEEGRRTEMVYTDGRYQDIILFGLTRKQFDERNRQV